MSDARAPLTVAELVRWEEHGATWRVADRGADEVTIELCTCSGEPVDLRIGSDAELLAYVRGRDASD